MNKIAVGIDFSEHTDTLVREAIRVGRHTGAAVVLVHVGEVSESHKPSRLASVKVLHEMATQQMEHNRAALATLREAHDGQGVEISHVLIDDAIDFGLCHAASELDADLVMTATHGRTGIKRFLLGSVAERVVRGCDTSVMVVRGGGGTGGYRKIVVAVDFDDSSDRTLAMARELAEPGGRIDVLHCWHIPSGYEAGFDTLHVEIEADARSQGEPMIAELEAAGFESTLHIVNRPAADGIRGHLKSDQPDLVVVGSHSRRGVDRLLLGSVAERVVRHAPCSVVVARGG